MKKILYLLFVFTIVACGGSDDDGIEDSDNFFDNHRGKVWVNEQDNYIRFEGNGEVGTNLYRVYTTQETHCYDINVGDNIAILNTCENSEIVITSNTSNRLEFTSQFLEGEVENGECVGLIDVDNVGPQLVSVAVNGNQLIISSRDSVATFNLVEEDIPSCFD